MTREADGWDERTEAIPGSKGDKSFELELDFAVDADVAAADETQQLTRPSIVVFEPSAIGLGTALESLGYSVRKGTTGVDVMTLVAAQPPAVVICAPAPDPERRRLLAVALRLRFPAIPVLYVSTHAGQEEAVLGAIREGARAVIAWPLPAPIDVARVLGPYVQASGRQSDEDDALLTPARPLTKRSIHETAVDLRQRKMPASSSEFEDAQTEVTTAPPPPSLPPDAMKPMPVPLPPKPRMATREGPPDEPTTQPNLRPAVEVSEPRGEIGQLLSAISPFLWSLEDAAKWADSLAEEGDPAARNHARALHLLARILAQLQARIDESGA